MTNDITTTDAPTATVTDDTRTPAEIDAEEKAIAELLESLFGFNPTAVPADYLDSGEPTTEEYPHSLTTGKVVANAGRVLVVLGQTGGNELVYDFRLENGELNAHRADKVEPKAFPAYVEPTQIDVTDAEDFSAMFDNEVLSIVVKGKDGTHYGLGFSVKDGELSCGLNYKIDADGNTSGTLFGETI